MVSGRVTSPGTSGTLVRRRAVVRLLVSAFFGAVWISALYWLMESGHEVLGPGLALPLLPFVYYLLELVSGRPVPELAKQWDALAGWQRGVLGTLVVITIFTIMITVVVFFVSA